MIQNYIIACYDHSTKNYLINDLNVACPKIKVVIVNNYHELESHLKDEKDVIVYFDKFFLGFNIKQEIGGLKAINNNASFVFVETGQCPIFLGMRLHSININGFICGIEDPNAVKNQFLMTFNNIVCFPKEVLLALNDLWYSNNKKYYSEVTARENEIIVYKAEGKLIKEISALINNISFGTISNHINRFCKKTGCKNFKEMIFLAESTKLNKFSV